MAREEIAPGIAAETTGTPYDATDEVKQASASTGSPPGTRPPTTDSPGSKPIG